MFLSRSVNNLLDNNDIVRGVSSRNKTTLIRADNFMKKRSDSGNQDFSNDFVHHIAKTNGSKLFNGFMTVKFRDKSYSYSATSEPSTFYNPSLK